MQTSTESRVVQYTFSWDEENQRRFTSLTARRMRCTVHVLPLLYLFYFFFVLVLSVNQGQSPHVGQTLTALRIGCRYRLGVGAGVVVGIVCLRLAFVLIKRVKYN